MLVKLDKQNMELIIRVGVLEKYTPNKDIKNIHKKVDKLKTKMETFMAQVVEPEMKDIESMIEEYNKEFIDK